MKKKTISLVIVLLAICIIFTIPKMRRPKLTPWPQTVNLLCCVLDNYDGLNNSEKHQFELTLESQPNSLSINKALVTLLQARTNNLWPLSDYNLSNGVFHDAWGTPLLFASINNATNSGLAPLLNANHRPFVAWSAGPNRTNDFGSGDDVLTVGR